MTKPTYKDIQFSKEQLDYLMRTFPPGPYPPETSEAMLRSYNGQQMVIAFIREKTRGVDPRSGFPA